MSHFTVVVVAEDLEAALAPYDENLEVPEYDDEEVDAEEQASINKYYFEAGEKTIDFSDPEGALPRLAEYYGKPVVLRDGKFVRRTTYNPKSKWDWWTVGGRWAGFFPSRRAPGQHDQILAGEIDHEQARKTAAAEARANFSRWRAVYESLPERPVGWSEVRRRYGDARIEEARKFMQDQPGYEAVRKVEWDLIGLGCIIDEYGYDEAAHVARRVDRALVPYAMLVRGEWLAKGKMGWWGISDDRVEQAEWNRKVREIYESLRPDEQVTLVDCHI